MDQMWDVRDRRAKDDFKFLVWATKTMAVLFTKIKNPWNKGQKQGQATKQVWC